MESYKGSHRAWYADTIKFQQEYAPGVSLCPKTAGKTVSKGENRDTTKKRISYCSQ
jgi:hypothetical protein